VLQQETAAADSVPRRIATADYERLRAHLTRAIARVCPRLLLQSREDLIQDCLVRVLDLASRSDDERQLSPTYLYKVAYSALIDEIRRRARRREIPLEDGESLARDDAHRSPEVTAAGREIGRGILDCLSGLHRERRLAVTLYLQGHSVVEAAQILDWSTKRTENLVYRALASLRQCLAAKGIKP
jgi:RNA polymerase sigma-70 factor, ECF subfamily